MPWYHIACMPGMDRLAEDLLCLYVRLWGGYGDTDQVLGLPQSIKID